MKRTRTFTVIIGFSLILSTFIFWGYNAFFGANFLIEDTDEETYIYIPKGMQFHDLRRSLEKKKVMHDGFTFAFVSQVMKYQEHVKPGRYLIKPGMNNRTVVSMLRLGDRSTEEITFNNIRRKEELPAHLCANIIAREDDFAALIQDSAYIATHGFNAQNIMSMFIPNTYEVYWNSTAEELFQKMKQEYDKFWTAARRARADSIGLSVQEVSVLASIVEEEAKFNDEKPRIAGVYLNRLKRNMLLQADPTLKYALYSERLAGRITAEQEVDTTIKNAEDYFAMQRIYDRHKVLSENSPYNTYTHVGLPPGPIRLPDISSIDAVLNAEKHNYLYFCAKEDFSGYHNFAKTLRQHNLNAQRWYRALNNSGIR